jgi:hypothetical protein
VSAAYQDQFAGRADLEVLDGPYDLAFDDGDNLLAVNEFQKTLASGAAK